MKNHLNTLIAITLLFFGTTITQAQDAATANDRDGIVLFVESVPVNQYRHLGTVECATFSPDEVQPLLDHVIKQARKEMEEFDALIFRSGMGMCKADIVQFYKDPKASRRRGRDEPAIDPKYKEAKAVSRNGARVFIQSSPTSEYQLLGKVETPVTFRSKDIEELITELVRISKEAYPDLDGVVIVDGSGLRKANIVKFK